MQGKDSSPPKKTSYHFTFHHHSPNTTPILPHPHHTYSNQSQRHLAQTSTQNAQLPTKEAVSFIEIPAKSRQFHSVALGSWDLPKIELRQSTEDDGDNQGSPLGCSFIDELLRIDAIEKGVDRPVLAELDIVQCESFRSSQTLEEQYSDIVSLTEEQKIFFSNFTLTVEEGPFDNVKTPRKEVGQVLEERKRVIRNFFRPKGSFMKEDRTCCNSQQNIDDINETMGLGSPVSLGRDKTAREKGIWTEARLISFNN